MITLTFQTPDEARAWDMYVAGYASGAGIPISSDRTDILCEADAMLLERRKRMAPEKVDHGWIPHKPGDPMPCDGDDWVHVQMRSGLTSPPIRAIHWSWEETGGPNTILSWRPA